MIKTAGWSIVAGFLLGCASAPAPQTTEPHTKLGQAYELLSIYRHVPARRLIDESIQIYQERGDMEGLAYAYSVSTDFYRYVTSDAYRRFYQDYQASMSGSFHPLALTAVLGQPLAEPTSSESSKAEAAYRRAIAQAVVAGDHFKASANYYRLFVLFARNAQRIQACDALDRSLEHYGIGKSIAPELQVIFDDSKYASFTAQIEGTKKEHRCHEPYRQ